ncbi:MAG: sulfurtransferase TusA family protein [Dehalococcoidia bacterium]
MAQELDARGLNCPIPVVRTRKALEGMEEGEITVIIERLDGCENVRHFAESQGCKVTNDGVRLTTEGSEVLDSLKLLEEAGVQILSCGTCLEYYELKGKLEVGSVTNMYDTVESLLSATKVVKI